MTKLVPLLLIAFAACAEHPCKQECLRQLSVWQREATAAGATIPSAAVCDLAAVVESESCVECEETLRSIAETQGVQALPACDAVTEAS